MLRFLSVTKNVALIWNLGIFTSKKLIQVYKNGKGHLCHKVVLTLLHGHCHIFVKLDVGTRNVDVAYITRGYIITEQLVALRSWRDNQTAISSSCQPISETCAVPYPAQKAKKAGYFLLECTQTELYRTMFKKIKSLL